MQIALRFNAAVRYSLDLGTDIDRLTLQMTSSMGKPLVMQVSGLEQSCG